MRFVIAGLLLIWTALSAVAYLAILPEAKRGTEVINAYIDALAIAESTDQSPELAQHAQRLRQRVQDDLGAQPPADLRSIRTLPQQQQDALLEHVRDAFNDEFATSPQDVPTLVWSTDDNPARDTQSHLFRVWHFLNYAQPVDIRADPSNRDITKAIVQSVAGAGPDLIESYGPEQLRQFVDSGIALDITQQARDNNFALDRAFDAAKPSMAIIDPTTNQWTQYAFPCNVGYTVLFYHQDLFEDAGIPKPTGPWSVEDATRTAQQLIAHAQSNDTQRFGIMNLGAWDMGIHAGGRFFNHTATACFYNAPRTVEGLTAFHNMIYRDDVSPTPAEAASIAAAGGSTMNADANAASASSLFAAKVAAMYVGGRWEYVSLAQRNRDRVIIPAINRELDKDDLPEPRRELLTLARDTIQRDVLTPLPDDAYDLMAAVLTDDDRRRLVRLGVTHVPSTLGVPTYNAGARVALVNRSSPNADLAVRFLQFLGSEEYNEQINQTFDSICGVPEFTTDANGIAGTPRALPGLEAMDSPVFADAMNRWARPEQISPFITRTRLGSLVGPILEDLQSDAIGPAEAARLIERRVNNQITQNLIIDDALRQRWEQITGVTFDPDAYLPDLLDATPHSRDAFLTQREREIAERQARTNQSASLNPANNQHASAAR